MKNILISICFLVLPIICHAQSAFKKELAVGVSFGTNFSFVGFTPKVDQKMLQGYTGGLTIRWLTEAHLGLQAEVNYVQQGWKEYFEEQPQYKYIRKFSGFEVPFLTHIYFGSDRIRFFFNLGPKVGYIFSESTESNLNGATPNRNNDQHDIAIQKKLDWGLCGGPGIEVRTPIGHFLLEGRYYYELGDIFNSTKSDPFARSNLQSITAKLTYLFPFK